MASVASAPSAKPAPAGVARFSPAKSRQPGSAAKQPPVDAVALPPPAIPTRVTPGSRPYSAAVAAYRTSVTNEALAGTPIRRNGALKTANDLAFAFTWPAEPIAADAAILERASSAMVAYTKRLPLGWAILLGLLTYPTRFLARQLIRAEHLLLAPFLGLRALIEGIGNAAHTDTPTSSTDANLMRVARERWPLLPDNLATATRVSEYLKQQPRPSTRESDCIVVPGIATDDFAGRLHPKNADRLRAAAADYHAGKAPFILVSGGNVHPAGTPFNEAYEMRRFLVDDCGVPVDRILVEPLAEHTPTNVRNAGRTLLALGLRDAMIVTDGGIAGQSMMFVLQNTPGLGARARALHDDGIRLGQLSVIDSTHIHYVPHDDVFLVPIDGGTLGRDA